ncbi:MAG TPA: MFS transporter [Burkholderiaceae bacterium]
MRVDAVQLAASPTSTRPSWVAQWYVLIMMCAVYTLSIADRYVISTVLEPIRLELRLTDFMVNMSAGLPLAIFYLAFGFPLSWLIDRGSRRNIVAFCLVAWSAMTMLCGRAQSALQFGLARIGVGIGEAGGTPGANSILSDYFSAPMRPMALAVFSLGAPAGAWLAAQFAGHVADGKGWAAHMAALLAGIHGWRAVFIVLGAPGIVAGLLIFLTVREPRRGQLDVRADHPAPSIRETWKFLLGQKAALNLMLASAITAFWGWGLMWFTPTFLQRTYGMTPGEAGELVGPMHLWGGILATVVTSWVIAQPWFTRDCRRIVWFLGAGIGLATVPSFIVYYTHSLDVVRAMLWIFVPAIYFYIGPCFGLLNNLSPPPMRAIFCATTLLMANLGNLILAPALGGLLSDWFAEGPSGDAASLRLALLCLAPTGFWATYHYFTCTRTMLEDEERATGVRA